MQVLRTVEQTTRERALLWVGSGFLALVFAWMGFAWWIGRPGEPIERALGVELPPGSRRVHSEHAEVDPHAPFEAVYVSATESVDAAVARYSAVAEESNFHARRFRLRGGTMVTVAPPDEVPATRLLPIHPITDGVPLGTRSWIVVTRGTPPAGTFSAVVPPDLGES
ncbi:MAG TPA: hypothetical protein VIL20_27125 [Sandaracinaceae bacterium]